MSLGTGAIKGWWEPRKKKDQAQQGRSMAIL